MNKRRLSRLRLAAAAALAIIGGGWILSLPPTPAVVATPPIPTQETDAALAALKPPKRERPLVAIIGINDATETTDYLMPYGILKRADVADVVALATGPGPVDLYPALKVQPDATVAEFDARHPQGADYVIVPAMSRDDDPAVLQWIRSQSQKGATVIGICAGAKVVGEAGLLDGRRATTHWYSLGELRDQTPSLRYVADRRMVVDGNVATTTGITASMPMMLTLVEAIAGREKAEEVARGLGLESWDAGHDSSAFKLTRAFALSVLANRLAFWNHERFGIALQPGMDEVSLALAADAWSRTYRSQAVTFAAPGSDIVTANGIRVVPDRSATDWPEDRVLSTPAGEPPSATLERALQSIAGRYGERTRQIVAMQLEYQQ